MYDVKILDAVSWFEHIAKMASDIFWHLYNYVNPSIKCFQQTIKTPDMNIISTWPFMYNDILFVVYWSKNVTAIKDWLQQYIAIRLTWKIIVDKCTLKDMV